jgi:hypothetical protein
MKTYGGWRLYSWQGQDFYIILSAQTGTGAHLASYRMGTVGGPFTRRLSDRSVKLTTHLHPVPRWRMVEYTSASPYIFIAWCLIKHKDNFILL